MAIRKDLSDMLNSLRKDGTENDKAEMPHEDTSIHRKSKYDEMSVDDLLNTLAAEKESGDESAQEPENTEVSNAEPPKHKKIVISAELPDYEAIRQRELEKDRLERERIEAEKREQERLERERIEAEKREQERLERERIEAEKREQERLERERIEAEKREQERLERERIEAEKREQERLERERIEAEKREQERLERERIEAEKREQERLERERIEAEKREQERLERERIEAEKREQERLERERIEAELAAQQLNDDPEENESAEDLINSALESIRGSEELDADENIDESDMSDVDTEENVDAADEDAESEGEDRVESLIDGMREDAENAIAELEKPAAPADDGEQTDTGSEGEEQPSEDAAESSEAPAKKGFIPTLNTILDESPDEIISERSEKNETEPTPDKREKGNFKKKLYTVLGAVFSVLAVIGLVTVIVKGVGFIRGFSSGEIKKDSFTEIIYPEVIMDIESFNDPSELTAEQMLTAAIWSIIMDDESAAKYGSASSIDILSIPDTDVEARAVEMFGTNHPEFVHSTIGPVESRFYYSDGVYNVEPRPVIFTYSPEITKIVKSGNEYTLTVDYISEMPEWVEKTVAKTAEYKLIEEEDGKYKISSMKILVKNTNL